LEAFCRARDLDFVAISAVTGQGVSELLERVAQRLENVPANAEVALPAR
jgi:translation initiation factor IF-2